MSLPVIPARRIASLFGTTHERCYVACKILTDPLYPAVCGRLLATDLPVLDIGCGMGVLAQCLRHCGWNGLLSGVDNDAQKIEAARRVCDRHGIRDAEFTTGDIRTGLPQHHGSVTILDMLQYLSPEEQRTLLESAAARVAPGGVLLIRSAMVAPGWRFRVSRLGDRLAEWVRWMRSSATHYPAREFIRSVLEDCGLQGEIRPLWGRTPFNNWLADFHRP